MSDWKNRSEISADVVFFPYVGQEIEQNCQEVFIWDLDKTYLDTRFETIGGLWQAAFEKAFQKRNVPGTAVLVNGLNQIQNQSLHSFALYFITASPPQLEPKIKQKLHFDGLKPFGLYFKDNIRNLHPRRWWRLTHQVGYKIQALLMLRMRFQANVKFIMWGDDSESDAIIYSLFSDICSHRTEGDDLRDILRNLHVLGEQTEMILSLQQKIPALDPVEKVYINLAEDTDADYYLKFGRRILPIYTSFQSAVDLFQDGRISASSVIKVAQDLVTNFGYTFEELERYLDDMVRRQRMGQETLLDLLPHLKTSGLINNKWEPSITPLSITLREGQKVIALEGSYEPWVPEHIDYFHDYR